MTTPDLMHTPPAQVEHDKLGNVTLPERTIHGPYAEGEVEELASICNQAIDAATRWRRAALINLALLVLNTLLFILTLMHR